MRALRIFFNLALLAGTSNLYAQTINCSASNEFPDSQWLVTCGFSENPDSSSLHQIKGYVFDPVAGRVIPGVIAETPTIDGFNLNMREALKTDQTYYVFAHGLTFKSKAPDSILTSKLRFKQSARSKPGVATKTAGQTFFGKIEGSGSKAKSDLYFAGEIWTVAGQDWNWAGSVDLKVQAPFRVGQSRFDHQISPFVTLQISHDPSADPDSLKYGGNWSARLVDIHGRWFKGLFSKEELRIESTRDFTNQNFISDTRFMIQTRSIVPANKSFHGFIEPFFGMEAGKNLEAPLPQVDGTGRARPLIGASFSLTFTKVPHLHSVGITSDLIRRWPLEKELGFKADSNNVLQLTSVGTAPKDRVTSKINFMFTEWFGAYFGHEYGGEPPAFNLVDNKLTTGILIQAKFSSSK